MASGGGPSAGPDRLDVDVTREDQENINLFSRLNTKSHELDEQIAAKKAAAEDLEEAGNEVMLLDDEAVPYLVGECFVHLPREEVEERLQSLLDETVAEVKALEAERAAGRARMDALKASLYVKFGNAINLEE